MAVYRLNHRKYGSHKDLRNMFFIEVDGVKIGVNAYDHSIYIFEKGIWWIGLFSLNAILKEYDRLYGTKYALSMWASDEGVGWRREDDTLIFYEDNVEVRLNFKRFVEAILPNIYCSYIGRIKSCSRCIFHVDSRCIYMRASLNPLREMLRRDIRNYIYFRQERIYDTFYWYAEARFKLRGNIENVIRELKRRHTYEYDGDRDIHILRMPWEYTDGYIYTIEINRDGYGIVYVDDYMEIESYDDYVGAVIHSDSIRRYVLHGLVHLCLASRGEIEVEYHGRWTGHGFRNFLRQVKIRLGRDGEDT